MKINTIEYHQDRQKKRQHRYRLRRRTDEVMGALLRHSVKSPSVIVDVGTADGAMLSTLDKTLRPKLSLGLDMSLPLLMADPGAGVNKAQADAQLLPLKGKCADALVATAVIEHLPAPEKFMQECARVVREGGLLIITTPDPMMEKIATAIGLLKEEGHEETLGMEKLLSLCREAGFEVLESYKFMFSPIGFPAEKTIERIFGPLGLSFFMANQFITARLVSGPSEIGDLETT